MVFDMPHISDFRKEFVNKKSRFISHEIKNHLGIINLYTKLLEKQFGENENTKTIFDAVNDITNLLNELKNIPLIHLEKTNLKTYIEEAIFEIKKYIEENDIILKLEFLDNIFVCIDKQKFKDILLNLIKNSKEALNKITTNDKYIRISTVKISDEIYLRIENNGEKIEKKYQQKIFEDGFTTKKNGSGIGLYLCKQYILDMGGELSLLKSDNKQTVFQIILKIIS